jgi:hypothetical protein
MNVQELVQRAVAEVHRTGAPPAEVAPGVLEAAWGSLGEGAVRFLLACGLAKLTADRLAAERARKVQEEADVLREEARTRWHEERAEEARALEERRDRYARYRRDRGLQDEARRIHEAIGGCNRKACQVEKDSLVWCIGGVDVLFAPEEEKARYIAERVKAREERERYAEETERLHAEMGCTRQACDGWTERERCVNKYVRDWPPEQWAERLARQRKYAEEDRREQAESWRRISRRIEECMGAAYAHAVEDMRSIMLLAGDTMKSLLDFTLDDVRGWKRQSRTRARSYRRRAAWFAEAERVLQEHGVDCVHDLPPEAIGELARHAESVWKKDSPAPAAG